MPTMPIITTVHSLPVWLTSFMGVAAVGLVILFVYLALKLSNLETQDIDTENADACKHWISEQRTTTILAAITMIAAVFLSSVVIMSAIKGEIRGIPQIQQAVETINDEHNLDINSIECPINLETNACTIYDNDGSTWRAYVNVVDMMTSQTTVITPVKNA